MWKRTDGELSIPQQGARLFNSRSFSLLGPGGALNSQTDTQSFLMNFQHEESFDSAAHSESESNGLGEQTRNFVEEKSLIPHINNVRSLDTHSADIRILIETSRLLNGPWIFHQTFLIREKALSLSLSLHYFRRFVDTKC